MTPNLKRAHQQRTPGRPTPVWLLVAFLLLGIFRTPQTARAQGETPPWLDNLVCEPEDQHYAGMEYCRGKETYANVHVIIVRLDHPGIKIEYVIASGVDGGTEVHECQDVNRSTKELGNLRGPGCDDPADRSLYPVFSLEQAAADAIARYPDQNVALLINGDYSACTVRNNTRCRYGIEYRDHGPEGLAVVRGDRLDGRLMGDGDHNAVNRPWLAISANPPLTAVISQFERDDGGLPPDWSWVYTGMGGAPWLIQDGDVVEWQISSCYRASGSCYSGASQTAVGLSQDGSWLFFVLAENHPTLLDLAQFMHDQLDIWQAIKFDGGGSSKLWYDGDTTVPGDAHMLTNFLAITAEGGTGIFPRGEPEPEPEPSEEPNLIERFQEWLRRVQEQIAEWFERQIAELVRRLTEMLQEAIRRAMEELVAAFEQWLMECCGMGLLPAGMVGTLFFWRKRVSSRKG